MEERNHIRLESSRPFKRGIYGVVCDRGLNPKRPVNEDSFLALEDACVFAVADGVGGQNAGEVASQVAVEILRHHFSRKVRSDRIRYLEQIIGYTNSSLYELAVEEESLTGMATTLALVLIESRHAIICHIGDSRVYRLTEGVLSRETLDHVLVEYEHGGGLSILEYTKRHILTRALGIEEVAKPDVKKIVLEPKTRFLLCTDGITHHISDEELQDILIEEPDPQTACDRLKDLCYERGARDNLTALIVNVDVVPHRLTRMADESDGETGEPARPSAAHRDQPVWALPKHPLTDRTASGDLSPREGAESHPAAPEPTGRSSRQPPWWKIGGPSIAATVISALLIFVTGLLLGRSWSANGSRTMTPAIALSPSEAQAHATFDQGIRHFNQGLYEQAERDFHRAVDLDQNNSVYHHWLGRVRLAAGKGREAAESFLKAVELRGSDENLLFAAAALEACGESAEADRLLQTYLSRQKTSSRR